MDLSNPPAKTDLGLLREALESGTMRQVRNLVRSLHPAEIADLLESLPPAERAIVWDLVDDADDGEVLLELNDEVRAGIIDGMEAAELVAATEGMDLDDLADFVADLPEAVTQQVIRSLSDQDKERLQTVLAYPEDSAGGLMNPDTISVRPDVSLEVVLRYLRMLTDIPDKTDAVFVVDRHGRYLGALYMSRLVSRDPAATVISIMDAAVEPIPCELPAQEVAREFKNRDLVSAPVVDAEGKLIGQITVDDVVDVIEEQAEHVVLSMAGLDEDDDMFAPVVTSVRRRAIWLGINLATAFLASAVVAQFEATLSKVVVLAVLMPVVASMGGIAGSQTLTLMIRGLALGRVENSNARWVMFKECSVGLLNGLTWAVVVGIVTVIFFSTWEVGVIIAAAITLNLIIAAFAGFLIPLVMRRLNIDPALGGSVVLTTVTDVVGFLTFLGLGALFLT
ncbi:MAG: magnesium transporter [Chromatiales bacterium]|nr:MAG: magnesium transporter [Chromatiales bacterium]